MIRPEHYFPEEPVEREPERKGLWAIIGLLIPTAVLFAASGITGCGSGTMVNSAGNTVPVARVQIEDTVGNVLKGFDDLYIAAKAKHDGTPVCSPIVPAPCETPEVHAAHRQTLLVEVRALRGAWAGLETSKRIASGDVAPAALCPVIKAMPDFFALAREFGVLKPEIADRYGPLLSSLVMGVCP